MLDLIGKVYNGATDVAGGSVGFIADTLRATREFATADFGEAAEVLYGSVQEDLLGGVVGGLFGPEGIGGGIIGALPEGVRAGGRHIVNPVFGAWDWTIQELVDRPLGTVATVINAGIAGGPQQWFDPTMYARAWEINDKRTFGQSVTAAIRMIDPFDEEEYNSIKDDPLFNLMSGTLDFFQEFVDPAAWTAAGAIKLARGTAVTTRYGRTFKTPERLRGRLLPKTGKIVPDKVFPDSISEAQKLGLRPTTIAGRGRKELGKYGFLVKTKDQTLYRNSVALQYVAARVDNGLRSAEWNKIEDLIAANPTWNANQRFAAIRKGLGARGRKLPVEVMRYVANGETRTARERTFRLLAGDQSVWDDIIPEVEALHEVIMSPEGEKLSKIARNKMYEPDAYTPPGMQLNDFEKNQAKGLRALMEDTDWALFAAFEDNLIMSQRKYLGMDPERGLFLTDPNIQHTMAQLDYKVQIAGLEALLGQTEDWAQWANGVDFKGRGSLDQLPMGTRTQALLSRHRENLKKQDTSLSEWRNPNTIGGENRVIRMITERIPHTHIFFKNESAVIQFERMMTAASRLNVRGVKFITAEQAGERIGQFQAMIDDGRFAEAQEFFGWNVGSANKWIDEHAPVDVDGQQRIHGRMTNMTDYYGEQTQIWKKEVNRVLSVGENLVHGEDRTNGFLRFTKDENANTLIIHHAMSPSQIKASDVIPRYDVVQRHIELAIKREDGGRAVKYGDLARKAAARGQVILDKPMAVWRSSVLLTPKWPMRVGLDEQLRLMAHLGTLNSLANFNGALRRMRRSFSVHNLKNFDEVADAFELGVRAARNDEMKSGIYLRDPIDPVMGPVEVPVDLRIGMGKAVVVDDDAVGVYDDLRDEVFTTDDAQVIDLEDAEWEELRQKMVDEDINSETAKDAAWDMQTELEIKRDETRRWLAAEAQARKELGIISDHKETIQNIVERNRLLREGAQQSQISAAEAAGRRRRARRGANPEAARRARQSIDEVKLSAREEKLAEVARIKLGKGEELDVGERHAWERWQRREAYRLQGQERKEFYRNKLGQESVLIRYAGPRRGGKPLESMARERISTPLGMGRVLERRTINFADLDDPSGATGYLMARESLPTAEGAVGERILDVDAIGSPWRNMVSKLGMRHPTDRRRQLLFDEVTEILDLDERGRLADSVDLDKYIEAVLDERTKLPKLEGKKFIDPEDVPPPEPPEVIERGSDFLGQPYRPAAQPYGITGEGEGTFKGGRREPGDIRKLTAAERRALADVRDRAAVMADEVEPLYQDWLLESMDETAQQLREFLQRGDLRGVSLATTGAEGPSHAHVLLAASTQLAQKPTLTIVVSGDTGMKNRGFVFDALDRQVAEYVQDFEVVIITQGYKGTERFARAWAEDRGIAWGEIPWEGPKMGDYPSRAAHQKAWIAAKRRHDKRIAEIADHYIGFKIGEFTEKGVRIGSQKAKTLFDWGWSEYHRLPGQTGSSYLFKVDTATAADITEDVVMRGPEIRKRERLDYTERMEEMDKAAGAKLFKEGDNQFGEYDSSIDTAVQDEIAAAIREEMPDLTPEDFVEEFDSRVRAIKAERQAEEPVNVELYRNLSEEDELEALAQQMREERGMSEDAAYAEAKKQRAAKIEAERQRLAAEEAEIWEAQAEIRAADGERPIQKPEPEPELTYLEKLAAEQIRTRPELDYETIYRRVGKEGIERAANEIIAERVLKGRDIARLRRNAGIKAIIGTGIVFGNPVMGGAWGYASYMSKQRKIRKAGQQRAAASYSTALRQQGRQLLKEATTRQDRKVAASMMSDADYIDSLIAAEVENASKIKSAFTAADELMAEAGLPSLQIGNMAFRNALGDDQRYAEQIRAEVSANSQMSAIYSGSYKNRRRQYEKYADTEWAVIDIEQLAIQRGKGAELDTTPFAESFDRMMNLYTTNTNTRSFYEIVWSKKGHEARVNELSNLLLEDQDLLKTLIRDERNREVWDSMGVEEVRGIAHNIVTEYDHALPPAYFPQTRAKAQSGQVGWKDVERELDKLIEDGQVLDGVMPNADENKYVEAVKEVRTRYENFGKAIGPQHTGPGDPRYGTMGQKIAALTEDLFVKYGSIPSDELARHPFFAAVYEKEMRRKIEPLLDEDGMVSLSQDAINKLEADSRRTALRETKRVLYDLNEESRLGELLGNASPFFNAWQEVASRWAGFAVDNPTFVGQVGRLYRKPWEAEALGLTEFEDENGRKYVALRLFGDAFDEDGNPASIFDVMPESIKNTFIPKLLRDSKQTIRFSKDGINTMLQMSPGAGPLVTIPLREAVLANPSLESTVAFMFPFGHPHADNFLERVLKMNAPTYLKAVDDLVRDTHTKEAVVARMFQDIMLEMQARGEPFDYADEQMWNEVQLEAEHRANQFFMFRIAAGLFSPTSTTWQSPYLPYMQAYDELEKQHGFARAQTEFLDKYGEEFFLATGTFTKLNDGVPASLRAEQEYEKYQELMQGPGQHVGAWISGSLGATGERFAFSQVAYNRQLSTPVAPGSDIMRRERKSGREMFADTQEQLGWREYHLARDIVNEYQDSAEEGGLSRSLNSNHLQPVALWWQQELTRIKAKYPDWAIQFEDIFASHQTLRDRLDGFVAGLHYEEIRNRPSSRHLLEYLNTRMVVQKELQHRYQTGGSRVLDADSNVDLLTYWSDFKDDMESRPEFSRLFREYFLRDEIHFMTFMEDDEMPEGWFV